MGTINYLRVARWSTGHVMHDWMKMFKIKTHHSSLEILAGRWVRAVRQTGRCQSTFGNRRPGRVATWKRRERWFHRVLWELCHSEPERNKYRMSTFEHHIAGTNKCHQQTCIPNPEFSWLNRGPTEWWNDRMNESCELLWHTAEYLSME